MKYSLFFLMLMCSVFFATAQTLENRLALVIGNSAYQNENALKNPVNDANLMAATLQNLGFTVIKYNNANRQQMSAAITEFWAKLAQANVALFYFAGHGVAVNGQNYLLPVDAQMGDLASVELDAISVSSIVAKFDKYPSNTNILILDACRNNPFKDKRGADRGFKPVSPTKGTLIAFAAADGEFASDNPSGNNGLFTEKLVEQMKQPVMIEQVFKRTRTQVQKASNNAQNPMEWSMLNGDFYFTKLGSEISNVLPAKDLTPVDNKIKTTEVLMDKGILADERDGQKYTYKKFGEKYWMTKNLNYQTEESWIYDKDFSNGTKYGRLYKYDDARNSCPNGWHLPDNQEWKELLALYGGEGEASFQSLLVGGQSGFEASLAGWRNRGKKFVDIRDFGTYWSVTEKSNHEIWAVFFDRNLKRTFLYDRSKEVAFSVRCVKD